MLIDNRDSDFIYEPALGIRRNRDRTAISFRNPFQHREFEVVFILIGEHYSLCNWFILNVLGGTVGAIFGKLHIEKLILDRKINIQMMKVYAIGRLTHIFNHGIKNLFQFTT